MNRYRFIHDWHGWHPLRVVYLHWSTWSDVCDFVPKPIFKIGVYLDESDNVLPDNKTSNKLGLLLNGSNGDVLIKEGEAIYHRDGIYYTDELKPI